MTTTSENSFKDVIEKNRTLFLNKNKDYGPSWWVLRYSKSFTDQIFIKAQRISSIQDKKKNLVNEPLKDEFVGIFNYSIMALIKHTNQKEFGSSTTIETLMQWYDKEVADIAELRAKKNHDYGEAWRDLRISAMTDLILMKLLRIKQIEENDGKTIVSEPIEANFQDIVNYAMFVLVLIEEGVDPMR
jgi:hypothetical protein